jgi:hypothetical protein
MVNFTINHECTFCNKKYKNKQNYDKHILLCNILNKSIKERVRENENIDDTPNVRELYIIIRELANKCEALERKVDKLVILSNKNKKKINLLEWLNCNTNRSMIPFIDWINSIQLIEEDMDYIIKNNFVDGIKYIIIRLLRDIDNIPIKSFEQKENVLYIYTSVEYSDKTVKNEWILMTPDMFESLYSKITKGLLIQLSLWKNKNIDKIYDDNYSQNYISYVKKITGGNLPLQEQHNKFRKCLYSHTKINMNSIIDSEYDLDIN